MLPVGILDTLQKQVIGKGSLKLQVDNDETVSIGGPDAYMEDDGAYRITLERLR